MWRAEEPCRAPEKNGERRRESVERLRQGDSSLCRWLRVWVFGTSWSIQVQKESNLKSVQFEADLVRVTTCVCSRDWLMFAAWVKLFWVGRVLLLWKPEIEGYGVYLTVFCLDFRWWVGWNLRCCTFEGTQFSLSETWPRLAKSTTPKTRCTVRGLVGDFKPFYPVLWVGMT